MAGSQIKKRDQGPKNIVGQPLKVNGLLVTRLYRRCVVVGGVFTLPVARVAADFSAVPGTAKTPPNHPHRTAERRVHPGSYLVKKAMSILSEDPASGMR